MLCCAFYFLDTASSEKKCNIHYELINSKKRNGENGRGNRCNHGLLIFLILEDLSISPVQFSMIECEAGKTNSQYYLYFSASMEAL